jgi:hypothetical protein
MTKKVLKILYVFILLVIVVIPILPSKAQGSYYTYRSTVTGTGAKKTGDYSYELVNQKDFFSTTESVYVLTRIFNITDVNYFSFKYDIQGNSYYKEFISPTMSPNRNWWAEIWYWKDFGVLPTGNYEINVAISINGSYYQNLDKKTINVGNVYIPVYANYECPNCNYNDYRDYNYRDYNRDVNYEFQWIKTGKGIMQTANYTFEIQNTTDVFYINEDVFASTKLANIRGIDHFQIKHILYNDNGTIYNAIVAPMNYPRYANWEYNYTWANFGSLPIGKYEIRSFANFDDRGYVQLSNKKITVRPYEVRQDARAYDCRYYNNCPTPLYYTPADYRYSWSQTDNHVNNLGDYKYSVTNPKSSFRSDEKIVILSKIETIKGIDRFQVRHELYTSVGSLIITNDSPIRYPGNKNWEYNYNWTDFGNRAPGSYYIKVYLSVNGGAYKLLDTKNIEVVNNYYQPATNNYYEQPSYNYQGSETGTGIQTSNNYYGNVNVTGAQKQDYYFRGTTSGMPQRTYTHYGGGTGASMTTNPNTYYGGGTGTGMQRSGNYYGNRTGGMGSTPNSNTYYGGGTGAGMQIRSNYQYY